MTGMEELDLSLGFPLDLLEESPAFFRHGHANDPFSPRQRFHPHGWGEDIATILPAPSRDERMIRRGFILGCLLAIGLAPTLRAGGGRILLHQGDVPHTITLPGSYALVSDLASTNTPAIIVQASDVVIDLNGYRITNDGTILVSQAPGQHRLTVRNGRIGVNGLTSWWGIFAPGTGNRFEDLVVRGATSAAIESGPGAMVRGCTFQGNPLNDATFSVLSLGPGSLALGNQFADNGTSGVSSTVLKTGAGSVVHEAGIAWTLGGSGIRLVSSGAGSVLDKLRSHAQVGAATNGLFTATGPVVFSESQVSERLVLPQGGVVAESQFFGSFPANSAFRHALGPHTVLHQSTFAGSASSTGALLAHKVHWGRAPSFGGSLLLRSGVLIDKPVTFAGEGTYVRDSSFERIDVGGNRHRFDGNHFNFFTQDNNDMPANADVLWIRNHHGFNPGTYLSVPNTGHIAAPGELNPWSNRP